MTNFFEQQQNARARTFWLVGLFLLAVLATTALVYPLAVFLLGKPERTFYANEHDPTLLLGSVVGVWGVIGLGSLFKASQLSAGGKSVALMVGGQEVLANTTDPRERRLLNIVEEMALASGLPMPAVFVLANEESINAFAAGLTPGDAVVAVSRGALEYLTRDELQGVVAHEFSHILNGDMRINFRMIILIAGLIGVSVLGRILLEAGSRGRSSNSGKDDGRGFMVLLGIGLFVIGMVGAFFGWLLQAAVSRQREYLADASAVQFTRNPHGIAGALMKIGAHAQHGQVKNAEASEVAHLFFADAFSRLSGLMATHPPLEDRIRRLLPNWDGKYPEARVEPVSREEEKRPPRKGALRLPGAEAIPVPVLLGLDAPAQAVERVGTVPAESTHYADDLLASLPDRLRVAIGEPFEARAVVFGLLLDRDPDVRSRQLEALAQRAYENTTELVLAFEGPLRKLPEAYRLPLVDLCIPVLRQMSPEQYEAFRRLVEVLINADGRLSVFEYVLGCVLERHLDEAFRGSTAPPAPPAAAVDMDVLAVFAFLAWEGNRTDAGATQAFEAARRHFGLSGTLPRRNGISLEELDTRLHRLAGAPLRVRRRVLQACVAAILADGIATVREVELGRAISDVLGLPMPPLPLPPVEARA